jgi:transcriptional regulator with XRE-family HTH domain
MSPGDPNRAATLARRLREVRGHQDLALSEVARRASISKAYLSQLEHGTSSHPSYDVIVRLATALGITVGELTGRPAVWEPTEAEQMPASLRAFAEGADIPKTDVSMLSKIHFRGKRPRSPEDWAHIYETIRRTIR